MKKYLVLLVCSFSLNLYSQDCVGRTKEFKKIIGKVASHEVNVIGSCISNDTLHSTVTLNGMYNVAMSGQIGARKATTLQIFEPFFKSAKLVFDNVPFVFANHYFLYFVEYKDIVDEYGNKIGKEKIYQTTLGLSRSSYYKINWKFIEDNLMSAIILDDDENFRKIVGMLEYFSMGD